MPGPLDATMSLARLIILLSALPECLAAEAKRCISAIYTFCKVIKRSPAEVLADPAVIRQLGHKACWQPHMKKSSWASVRSSVNRALKLGGVKVMHRDRRNYKRTPAWEALLNQLSERAWKDFTRFAGWCSSMGVEPEDVTVETWAQFRDHLLTQATNKHIPESWHRPRRIWNNEVVPLYQGKLPHIPNIGKNETKTLQWSAFPDTLGADVDRYVAAMKSPDWTEDSDLRALSPATIRNNTFHLRLQLSLLVKDGEPPERFKTLADCIDLSLIKRGIKLQAGPEGLRPEARPMLWGCVHAYISVARYLGKADTLVPHLTHLLSKLRDKSRGLKQKNKERLAQFDDPKALKAFYDLPLALVQRLAKSKKAPSRRDAFLMRGAAMLELLFQMPLRMRNVVALDFEKHVQLINTDEGQRWRILIPEHEVKNKIELSAVLPVKSTELLELWRHTYRPILAKPGVSKVFIGEKGNPIGEGPLSKFFSKMVMRELGLEVHPHLMRHLAAKLILKAHPGAYELVRQLLGHKNISTTINSYCTADVEAAFALFDDIVNNIRSGSPGADYL